MTSFSKLIDQVNINHYGKANRNGRGWRNLRNAAGGKFKTEIIYDTHLDILYTKEELAELKALAKSKNTTVSELVRTFIEWGKEVYASSET